MRKAIIVLICLVLVLLVALAYHNGPQKSSATIKIGFLGPLSGDEASFGENQKRGLDLALEEINNNGGVNGQKIEIVYEDTQCDSKKSVSAAHKLIEQDKVSAIIGESCSSAVLAIAPIVNEAKIPAITVITSSDKISGVSKYVFRSYVPNLQYATHISDLFQNQLKYSKVALLYINNDYGNNLADDLTKVYKGQIVFKEGYAPDTKDFRSLLAKAQASKPDVIMLAGYYADGALITKQAYEQKITIPLFGSSDVYDDSQFIILAGLPATNGFTYVTAPTGGGPEFKSFRDAYYDKYKEEPRVYSDYAYDSFYALIKAMRSATDLNGDSIADELRELNFAGASNIIDYNDQGDLVDPQIIMKRINQGRSEEVK